MAIHRGKTAELLIKVADSKIEIGDKVIITDNEYAISDINDLYTASGFKIKLEKTSAATVFEGTAAELIAVLEKVESYTGPVRATPAADADDINTLAGLTTGEVTGTITSALVDSDLVDSLTNVKTTDKISFTANVAADTLATDIVALKAKLPLANFSAITGIEGRSYDIAALKSAANIVKSADVTIASGEISAANANALAKISSGDVKAKVTAGSAAALNKALVDAKSTDELTLTVSGKTATAADLKALAGKTSVAVDADSIETITGNAKDVIGLLALAATEITLNNTTPPAITVSGTISAADANTIASDADAGVVTALIAAGTANSLKLALNAIGVDTNKLSLTVLNNSDGSATSAADLDALDGKTASKIKVDAKALTGTADDLIEILVTNKDNFTGLGNKAVTIKDAPADADKVNAILKATSGVVTATVTGDAADLREALVDAKATDKLTLTVTGPATAADLKALDAKTSEAVKTAAGIVVNGNAADIKAVIKSAGVDLATDAVINVTTGKISAADANTIINATSGVVTAEVTAGSAAALNKALVDSNGGANALTLTVTGATAAAADLKALDAKTTEDVVATAVKTITGSLADLNDVYAAVTIELNAVTNATVNGILTVADVTDLKTLLSSVIGGKVTATVTPATADALVTALGGAGASIDALTLHVVEDRDGAGVVTATEADDLVALDAQTSVKVKVDATQITGDYTNLEKVYVTNKAGFSNLGNETVAITGSDLNAARVDSILKATTGIVTADVETASASYLVANLKNAKNDALSLEISATETKASDLKILDTKTSEIIDADSISKLVGNAADVKTVLKSDEIGLGGNRNIEVTGKISIADANTITSATTGIVTAEVAAGTAAALKSGLADSDGGVNALKLTVTGTTANAADLNGLNGKTSVDVNAAAIKTVTGDSADIAALYNAVGGVSGLGNEAVNVTNLDALWSDIASINTDTTGVVKVSNVTTDDGTGVATFKLTDLGDLDGITGLYNLNTADTETTLITLSIAELLAANDSKKSFDFSVTGESGDTLNFTDVSGWTSNEVVADSQYTFTKGTQTITVNLTGFDAGDVAVLAV